LFISKTDYKFEAYLPQDPCIYGGKILEISNSDRLNGGIVKGKS